MTGGGEEDAVDKSDVRGVHVSRSRLGLPMWSYSLGVEGTSHINIYTVAQSTGVLSA